MKPLETIGKERTADGVDVVLYKRDTTYEIRVDGLSLMSSRAHGSEQNLAELVCADLREKVTPRVLIGGLGFGYTLRAALDLLPAGAQVVLSEVFEAVVAWNRGPLGHLAGNPMADPRVRVERADVYGVIGRTGAAFDAVMLDVDNGPDAFTLSSNGRLYTRTGLHRVMSGMAPDGILGVWSADPSPQFVRRLSKVGFQNARDLVLTSTRVPQAAAPAGHGFAPSASDSLCRCLRPARRDRLHGGPRHL